MTGNQFRFHGLERLASEHGLDVRSTVLRVATDLFCQTHIHTPSDVTRYVDLALALLETADASTRNAVAAKLATAPHAPERLLRRLLDDPDVRVSGPILSHSPALAVENLADFLAGCGPAEAAAVARRVDIDASTIRLIASHPHLLVVEALLENTAVELDATAARILVARAQEHAALAALLFAHPHLHSAELAPLYQAAPANIRSNIRADLEQRTPNPAPPPAIEALPALNDAVLAADRNRIGASLAKVLQFDPAGTDRILDDPTGEVFALALSAAGIKRAPAINLLLIAACPDVRTSVERIFAAADVYETTSRRVAREIVVAVAGERRAGSPAFESHMHPSGTPQRAVSTQRRPFARRERRTDVLTNR